MKKKPAVRHRLSTVQRIFFSYVFICLVPVVILAGVLAVSTFRAQQREDAARQFPSQYWFTIGLSGVFSLTG